MKKPPMHKQKKIILTLLTLGVCAAAISGIALLRHQVLESVDLPQPAAVQTTSAGVVEGLKPGETVFYTLATGGAQIAQGRQNADEQGRLAINLPQDMPQTAENGLNLSLEVSRETQPLRFDFKTTPSGDGFKISGGGLKRFSDIKIDSGAQRFETKSDWTGAFNFTAPAQQAESAPEEYRLALYGSDFMNETAEENPLIVKVLLTNGGGGPTTSGVNKYMAEGCDENPKLSVCQDKFEDHTKDLVKRYIPAFQMMTGQFTTIMMKYMTLVGEIMDAKMQLQTQANFQRLQAQAHKDYHPSEQMCRFGSFVKSVATVEESARFNTLAFNKIMMNRYNNVSPLGQLPGNQTDDIENVPDMELRLKQFREVYCDPADHNNGLEYMCQHKMGNKEIQKNEDIGGADPQRMNNDIDYIRVVDTPLTLDVDFYMDKDATPEQKKEALAPDEEDVIALAKNLYWPDVFSRFPPGALEAAFSDYMNVRNIIAVSNIAHNSFAHIVGMKSASVPKMGDQGGGAFMKSFMREFGLSDTDIEKILGENPSYYAQMEVLTKKMYQSPDFYTALYDKPANVKRIGASMEAIKLMQMRDWFQTNLRREMLTSMMLEKGLAPLADEIDQRIGSLEASQ